MSKEQVTFPLAPVYRRKGVEFVQARAVAIWPEGDSTDPTPAVDVVWTSPERTGDNERLRYDYLVNATGPKLRFDATPGLGPDANSWSVCTADHAVQTSAALEVVIGRLRAGTPQTIVIGTVLGAKLLKCLPEQAFRQVVSVLVLALGVFMTCRGLVHG